MRKLEKHIKTILKKHRTTKYIVACSGGVDSTVLLHCLSRLRKPAMIAHVNYHLRGEDSNLDEAFLRSLANELKVDIEVHSVNLNEQLKNGGNLQDLARKERYDFFEEILSQNLGALILLAHHKEDQSETFFMNLSRNAGVMGLASMPEKRGHFIRPLLSISKNELIDYAQETGIEWREDLSNKSNKYTRNVWRNELLPNIRKSIPEIDDSIQTLVSVFQSNQVEIEKKITPLIQKVNEQKTLTKQEFDNLNNFEKVELCRQLKQAPGILETWNNLIHKGTKVDFATNDDFNFDAIVFNGDSYSFLSKEKGSLPEIIIDQIEVLPATFSKDVIHLDSEKIDGDLILRYPKEGDRIHPIGMNGSKLVSDVISDAKLDAQEKQKVCVLCDQSHILWIPGLSVSRKAIARNDSDTILKIHLLSE